MKLGVNVNEGDVSSAETASDSDNDTLVAYFGRVKLYWLYCIHCLECFNVFYGLFSMFNVLYNNGGM